MQFEIDISTSDAGGPVDRDRLAAALKHALEAEHVQSAVLSVSIVDNAAIHQLNRTHLNHDYPTDVISFQLDWTSPEYSEPPQSERNRSAGASVEGEIVVSREYATEMAPAGGWSVQDELTLYAVHGMLHICGYDDLTPAEKEIMRSREQVILAGLGLNPQYPNDGDDDSPPPPLRNPSPGAAKECSE